MNTQEAANKYEEEISHNGKPYKVIINSYNEPIRKNGNIRCYTRVSIMDGIEEWGHTYLPDKTNEGSKKAVFQLVADDFEKFKNVY